MSPALSMAQLGVAGELRNKACAPLHLNVEWQLSEPFDFRFVAIADIEKFVI